MKVFIHIARILLGLTFIFSGFVKGIDPWGSAYKFADYFNAMGLGWMEQSSWTLGMLRDFAELVIGMSLLFNVKIRFFSWCALIFMIFFTPLTLWIALKNPVSDCGCFGDALVISNWATFYKNLFFITLAIIVVIYRKQIKGFPGIKTGYILAGSGIVLYLIAVVYSVRHEPLIDFRPYNVGVNIQEGMIIPAGAPKDVYENIFYYKNKQTGKIKKFTEKNYPWQDSLHWEFSSMDKARLISKGYTPPIHGFTIETRDGDNIYDFFLNDDKFVFMLIAYDLDKTSLKNQDKINELAKWAKSQNYSFICLTASLFEKCDQFTVDHDIPYEFFNCDEIALKTIIRSNPGLVVLKKGTIIAKYHFNDIPNPGKFARQFLK
jgi:uncharacterized membrane protein YphA (DoxX/SURF4 family)